MSIKIFHNPRCSKSRQTLALIQAEGIEPEIIEYLKNPPSVEELDAILTMLKLEPEAVMRRGEADFKEHIRGNDLSRREAIELMITYPKVIERPIVINGDKAAIGRPPENALTIL